MAEYDVIIVLGLLLLIIGGSTFVYGWAYNYDTYILIGGIVGAFGLGFVLAGFYLAFRGIAETIKKLVRKFGLEE